MEGLLPLARFCGQQGDHPQALHYATRGRQIAQRYGWRQHQAQALILCAQAQASLHQVENPLPSTSPVIVSSLLRLIEALHACYAGIS